MDVRIAEILNRIAELAAHKPQQFIEFEKIIWRVFEMGKEVGKIEKESEINTLIQERNELTAQMKDLGITYVG